MLFSAFCVLSRDMNTLPDTVAEVRILNSENKTHYYFTLRKDRIVAFYQYLLENRAPEASSTNAMPGISGSAHFGLDCIFFGAKSPRFPAKDILTFLRDEQKTYLGEYPNPTVTVQEVEHVLGQWAGTVTQLLADGSERA